MILKFFFQLYYKEISKSIRVLKTLNRKRTYTLTTNHTTHAFHNPTAPQNLLLMAPQLPKLKKNKPYIITSNSETNRYFIAREIFENRK